MSDGASSISVAVRVRPFSEKERQLLSSTYGVGPALFNSDPSTSALAYNTPQPPRNNHQGSLRKALKVLDDRILVFDPPESNASLSTATSGSSGNGNAASNTAGNGPSKSAQLPMTGKKAKDIRFCFDRVFDEDCGQEDVYEGSARELVGHVMNGFHSTVFAYGATGCGKTHTISGNDEQPGIVFLIMKDLFARIAAKSSDTDFSLTVSYLEIYNETIRDLLEPEKGPLQLRESNGMATPANLSTKEPTSALDVVEWITLGNENRTVNATEANATSSRSHAVLRVTITQKPKAGGLTDTQSSATLSVIDLAGSERASVTKNKGDRLIEGANINRSLLALGNCINALCDPRKRGHVPYRDSKLTRLLKQSLGGNCKTVMIVCVSPSSAHYDETHNTLQYANRAKEIKTKAIRNVVSVDRHVAQYCQQIMQQAEQIELLKKQLAERAMSSALEDRDEDAKAVTAAKARLHASWESSQARAAAAERASAEKNAIDCALEIFQQWKTTALHGFHNDSSNGISADSTVNNVRDICDTLITSLSVSSARLRTEVNLGHGAMDGYALLASDATASMRSGRPGALPTLQLELKVLEGRFTTMSAEAKAQGIREGSKAQARVMQAFCEARSRVSQAFEQARGAGDEPTVRALVRLADGIDAANRDACVALLGRPSNTTLKRDAGTRSPLETDLLSKAPKTSSNGGLFSSLAPPSSAIFTLSPPSSQPQIPASSSIAATPRVTTAMFPGRKASPRKSVSHPRRVASPKKRKEVQWRDETGDGWELEDVKWRSPSTPDSLGSVGAPAQANPQLTVTTAPSPGPRTTIWTASSTNVSTAASSAAEMMALRARSLASGQLRNKASAPLGASRLSPLPRVSEIDPSTFFSVASTEPLASTMAPPPVPTSWSRTGRSPSSTSSEAAANTSIGSSSSESSFSMASNLSGLYAPMVSVASSGTAALTPRRAAARRRISQIGPQRSAKASRRTSFVPPTPSGGSKVSSASTLLGTARKPLRVAGSGPGGGIVVPSSVRRSPRKLLSGGSSAARRTSMVPPLPLSSISNNLVHAQGTGTGLAAASGTLPTIAVGGFGAKSAARIAARRESSMAAQAAVMAGGSGGSRNSIDGPGVGTGAAKRDSPLSAAAVASSGASKTLQHWR